MARVTNGSKTFSFDRALGPVTTPGDWRARGAMPQGNIEQPVEADMHNTTRPR